MLHEYFTELCEEHVSHELQRFSTSKAPHVKTDSSHVLLHKIFAATR